MATQVVLSWITQFQVIVARHVIHETHGRKAF
jgi:hypothetical protein